MSSLLPLQLMYFQVHGFFYNSCCYRHICAWMHIFTQVNNLSPFRFAHTHMCAGLATWDRTSYVRDHSWRRLISTWGGACVMSLVPVGRLTDIITVLVLFGQPYCWEFMFLASLLYVLVPGSYNLSAPLPRFALSSRWGVVWETCLV